MGLFDYLKCEYPIDAPPGLTFQTKDTDEQYMEMYKIDADGYLWLHETKREFKPDETKQGLSALLGCMKIVSQEWKRQDRFRGEIVFYADDTEGREWAYSAFFDEGKIFNIKTLSAGVKEENPV